MRVFLASLFIFNATVLLAEMPGDPIISLGLNYVSKADTRADMACAYPDCWQGIRESTPRLNLMSAKENQTDYDWAHGDLDLHISVTLSF